MAVPQAILPSTVNNSSIECLVRVKKDETIIDYPWAKRMLANMPIPVWQRDLCWDLEDKIALIESIFMGFLIGGYMQNSWKMNSKNFYVKYSDIILDGQQRIDAIDGFYNNKFSLDGTYFKDLSAMDRNRFLQHPFPKSLVSSFDEDVLRETYNRLNFTGKRHSESQRA
ncbi:hypothetical protein C9J21_18355 [Photobacterium phosphoreum]|uniref:DUF262 domain-containing protein n=1 Tax=Photobacterium phosphoreum TaxID=659 RepID=UPI000D17DD46|nr:DUF262 domain-containing protein [Photobacterium phosphoreum]PSW30850.1 hypothetical protein C9J21_18355 [Photobacterium phosphoreum]